MYEIAREKYEAADRAKKLAEAEFDQVIDQFWTALSLAGLKSFRREDGTGFVRGRTIYSKVVDRDVLFAELEKAGLDDWIVTDVRKAALNEYVKDCLDNDKEMMPGVGYSETRSIRRIA